MTASKYPSYKDVPIPWIASIPEHWDWKPVLGTASERDENNKGIKEDNLLSLSYGNIVNKDINNSDGLLPESFETYQIVRPGDIILRLTDLQNDKRSLRSALVTQKGIITSAYLALKPESIDSKYLGYLLRAYDVSKVFYSMGGGLRQSMKYGDIKRMPLVIPSKTEQNQIAAFLDRETAKIDALFAEQQHLIELLQEKRQAVISHAVTKGLNPDAPMKHSGVEWLGEVPEHWETGKIKHYFRTTSGSTPNSDKPELYYTTEEDEQGTPWIRTTDIDNDEVNAAVVFITPKALEDTACKALPVNTVLVALYGGGGTVGKNGILKIEAAVNQALCGILPSPKALPEYVHRYIQFLRPFWMERAVSARKAGNISQELVGDTTFLIPPLQEQTAILRAIEEKLEELDELAKQSSESLVLLEERRSALISAAVTGQIDVRGLVETEAGKQ